MIDRILKAMIALVLGGLALMYVTHNIANLPQAHDFFVYTTSHTDQEAYPVTLLPVPPEPLIWLGMIIVFTLEIAAGVALLWGAFAMWGARSGADADFEAAKKFAKIGMGCAIFNWWGLFQVIAVAGYQLWQMPLGGSPDHGSWVFGAMNMLGLIYISRREATSAP
jgi:predicted small integral membrane protein